MDANESEESRQLVDDLRAGKREALNSLFARHEPYLRRVVGFRLDRRVRRRVAVSDVVQQTQVDAFERIDEYLEGEPMPFRWWLRRAAHDRLRRVHREHRAGKRAVAREISLADRTSLQIAALAGGGTSPSGRAVRRELAARVRRALGQLSETDREVLMMRNFEEMPYDAIGYVLGIDPTAARMRHGRALVRLGKILRKGGLTEG